MADIQQWRRRIQPARARTPAPTFETDDTDDMASPSTPKQCLKSKVSSYFDFRQHTKTASFNDDFEPQLPTWPTDELYPDPDAEYEMDSVMCTLMADPYARLDARFNGALMRIFEKFMSLKEEKEELQKRLDQEIASSTAVLSKFNMAEKDWQDEKQDYKDEIKRLEIILAKTSKRGVAEVTLARQDSKLRRGRKPSDDNKETIFEFLDKMKRFNDRFYSSQRATMKPILQSPSSKDQKTSQTLAQKKSMTNILADLPFGTPPTQDARFSLTHVSMLEQQSQQKYRPRSSTETSEDTFSAFSCEVAFQPRTPGNVGGTANVPDAVADSDLSEIIRFASVAAQRRNIDFAQVLPKLLDLFKAHRGARTGSEGTLGSMPEATTNINTASEHTAWTGAVSRTATAPVKRQTVMKKASGLFHKFKPQQSSFESFESGRVGQRRFSFEPGDDAEVNGLKPLDLGAQDPLLRKSVSLDVLPQSSPTRATLEQVLSPVAASPTPSIAAERPPSSRIPTPKFNSISLARPRQDREDSSSSLLTAIRLADDPSKRSSSLCSSVYSSPSASREDVGNDVGAENPLQDAVSNSKRFLDHTNALRNSNVRSPAAKATCTYGENSYDPQALESKASARGKSGAYTNEPDVSDARGENMKPMNASPGVRNHQV